MTEAIPTYIINLNKRPDRKAHVLQEFSNREEFQVHVTSAVENSIGSVGLWHSIRNILQGTLDDNAEYTLICEDDHRFTRNYSKEKLQHCIAEAKEHQADILLGGVSWFADALQVSQRLLWVDKFSGTQFLLIFKKFFKPILKASFGKRDSADYKICSLTDNKFFMHPFISVQRDFGYSDATLKNNKEGRVSKLFEGSDEKARILKKAAKYYISKDTTVQEINAEMINNIIIPTYVIDAEESKPGALSVAKEFKSRKEFDLINPGEDMHTTAYPALWDSIKNAIKMAKKNDDDAIIICKSNHAFTRWYNRDFLVTQVLKAHALGCNILCGGVGKFHLAVPVTENLYWIDSFQSAQFIVLFKKVFEAILVEPFSGGDTIESKLSEITSHKMVVHPFISSPQYPAYPGTESNVPPKIFPDIFKKASDKINKMKQIMNKFSIKNPQGPLEELKA